MPTFGEVADDLIASLSTGFRNAKHRAQWRSTLSTYAADLRPKPVDEIGTAEVLAVLKPIWQSKAETASRLRGRIEKVLDAAKAKELRTGENPARWRGHLDHLLPKPAKLTRGHHAAMAYAEVPGFVADLHERPGVAAAATEFLILTVGRSSEINSGARWLEFDLDAAVWTVPAGRMKAHREHRVPLSDRACEILKEMRAPHSGRFRASGPASRSPALRCRPVCRAAPHGRDGRDRSRLPLLVPRLGWQRDKLSSRDGGARPGARHRG